MCCSACNCKHLSFCRYCMLDKVFEMFINCYIHTYQRERERQNDSKILTKLIFLGSVSDSIVYVLVLILCWQISPAISAATSKKVLSRKSSVSKSNNSETKKKTNSWVKLNYHQLDKRFSTQILTSIRVWRD